jgi:chemotaxis protein CheY-P-specific phosphatase CheC
MKKKEASEKMMEAAIAGLEKLAFIFAFPSEDPGRVEDPVKAEVSFKGTLRGTMTLEMPSEVLPELAANMLGMEGEAPSVEKQYDALGETANVICGTLLPSLAGEEAVFDIGAPRVGPGTGTGPLKTFLRLDQGLCALSLSLEDPGFFEQ